MNIGKIVKNAVITVAILAIVALVSLFVIHDRTLQKGCDEIAEIANNVKAVSHLDAWVMDNFVDKGYQRAWGMHGDIVAVNNGEFTQIENLPDENITGIEHQYFRLTLQKSEGEFNSDLTKENIRLISIGRGRNKVIILKNGMKLESYRDDEEDSGKLLKVNESVYAYCADSRF